MADYVYDWSSSEDKANWSLTLLSTNSVLSSLTSMVTTSPESTLKPDRNNNSSGGDTLAGVNFLKQVPVLESKANYRLKRQQCMLPESPTDRIVK
ncbi:hypothetical protein H4R26_001844, partial [Coemansia thaxteri]